SSAVGTGLAPAVVLVAPPKPLDVAPRRVLRFVGTLLGAGLPRGAVLRLGPLLELLLQFRLGYCFFRLELPAVAGLQLVLPLDPRAVAPPAWFDAVPHFVRLLRRSLARTARASASPVERTLSASNTRVNPSQTNADLTGNLWLVHCCFCCQVTPGTSSK